MRLRSKAAYLTKRVNPGVGASGGMQNDVLLSQSPKHANDFTLDCGLVRLNLPAVEIGAVVRDGELEIAHAGTRIAGSGCGAKEAAPRLHRGAAAAAERAIFFLVAGNRQLDQGLRINFEVDFPSAPVDQRTGSNDARASLFDNANGFLCRAPGSPHVLNDEHVLVRSQRKPAPQRHHAAGIAFHKECWRSSTGRTLRLGQRSGDFLPDDEPPDGR